MRNVGSILLVVALCVAVAGLAGCKTMGKKVYPGWAVNHIGEEGTQELTAPGESVVSVSSGVYSWELKLQNAVHGDGVGNSIDFPPGRYGSCFECVEEDKQHYYFYYPRLLTLGGLGLGAQVRAGFRVNKDDHEDIMAFTPSDIGYQSFDMSPAPQYKVAHMYSLEDEYRIKKIVFESFDDDILTLRYEEVEGPGDRGPKEQKLTLQFDLLESRRIQVKGAEFEVVSAKSDLLVVKVLKSLTL